MIRSLGRYPAGDGFPAVGFQQPGVCPSSTVEGPEIEEAQIR
jgi:hypothetical protein